MSLNTAIQNVIIESYNSGTTPISSEINRTAINGFIDPKQYDNLAMAITRFSVPISSIPLVNIDSSNVANYGITMGINSQFANGTNNTKVSPSTSTFKKTTQLPIYSPEDYLQNLNLALLSSWNGLVSQMVPPSGATGYNCTYTNVLGASGVDTTHSITMPITVVDGPVAYCKLTISNFTPTTPASTTSYTCNVSLQNPDGTITCRVASGLTLESGKTYVFSDDNYALQSVYNSNGIMSANPDGLYQYQSQESLSRFHTVMSNGNWKVIIDPCGCGPGTFDWNSLNLSLFVQAAPSYSPVAGTFYTFPSLPPYYSLDRSTGFLSFNCQESWLKSGFYLTATPFLKQVIDLDKNYSFSTNIQIPVALFTSGGNTILSFQADVPRMYLMSNIFKILVNSSNLNIDRDAFCQVDTSNSGENINNTIVEYLVDNDLVQKFDQVYYTYNSGDLPLRRFRFNSTSKVYNINISFSVKYKNGSTTNIMLQPAENIDILLSFFGDKR